MANAVAWSSLPARQNTSVSLWIVWTEWTAGRALDYRRLLEITGDYWRLQEITGDYWRLLEITGDYWRLLEITGDYWRLLEITGDYWRLLEITGDYWRLQEITGCSDVHSVNTVWALVTATSWGRNFAETVRHLEFQTHRHCVYELLVTNNLTVIFFLRILHTTESVSYSIPGNTMPICCTELQKLKHKIQPIRGLHSAHKQEVTVLKLVRSHCIHSQIWSFVAKEPQATPLSHNGLSHLVSGESVPTLGLSGGPAIRHWNWSQSSAMNVCT